MIPKQVHVTWPHKDIIYSNSPLIQNGIANLMLLNPDWTVTVSNDCDVDNYLRNNLSAADYELLEPKHIVEKTDVWRLLKIFNEGGLYMDLDRFCNVDLNSIAASDIKCILPTAADHDFSQDFMCSEPGNPIYKETLDLNLQRRREGCNNVYYLGAQTYMHAITNLLCGHIVNSDPGVNTFAELRDILAQMNFIKTYREQPPFDTVIYQHDIQKWRGDNPPQQTADWEKLKRNLYQENKLRHWTNTW